MEFSVLRGLARALRTIVLERGTRIDQAARGSELGLANVCKPAELYGGFASLDDSSLEDSAHGSHSQVPKSHLWISRRTLTGAHAMIGPVCAAKA